MKTSELTGAALDWAVAQCEGISVRNGFDDNCPDYSSHWSQGGPIIERERLCVYDIGGDEWGCDDNLNPRSVGPTPLVAAMRCYVASKLGDDIELPKELT